MTTETAGLYEKIIEETDAKVLLEREISKKGDNKDGAGKDSNKFGSLVPVKIQGMVEGIESLLDFSSGDVDLNLNDYLLDDWMLEQMSRITNYMKIEYSFLKVYSLIRGFADFIGEHRKEIDFTKAQGNMSSFWHDATVYTNLMAQKNPQRRLDIGDTVIVRNGNSIISINYSSRDKVIVTNGGNISIDYSTRRDKTFPIGSIGLVIDICSSGKAFIVRFKEVCGDWGADNEEDYAKQYNKKYDRKSAGFYYREELEYVPINNMHINKFYKEMEKLRKMIEK